MAWSLVLLTVVPALFLPRKHEESHLLDDEGAAGRRALTQQPRSGGRAAAPARPDASQRRDFPERSPSSRGGASG